MPAGFVLTPRAPSVDSRVGGTGVELSATLATFGGMTGPEATAGLDANTDTPLLVLGGNPVVPGTPPGTAVERARHCAVRLRLVAEGLARGRQCLLLAAMRALAPTEHRVQVLLGHEVLAEDIISGEDRVAVLLDVPDDGRLQVELWLRLASHDPHARLGLRGVQGQLL